VIIQPFLHLHELSLLLSSFSFDIHVLACVLVFLVRLFHFQQVVLLCFLFWFGAFTFPALLFSILAFYFILIGSFQFYVNVFGAIAFSFILIGSI